MMKRLVAIITLFTLPFSIMAANVQIKHKGITLNANLVMADGKGMSDGIILMTHGTLAHGKMEIMSGLQEMFKERGVNTISITLGLGISDRKGMYDCKAPHRHKHTDAVEEIGVWLNWLKQKGANKVYLLGHSRGGNQTAWFASEHDDKVIQRVFLVGPATWDAKYAVKDYNKRYKKDLHAVLNKAKALVKAGKGKQMMKNTDFIYCADTSVDAESFVSYYTPDPRFDTPYLVPKIRKPVVVFAGSEDKVVKNLIPKMKKIAGDKNIELRIIEGAGHFFRDLNSEDVADAIVEMIGN